MDDKSEIRGDAARDAQPSIFSQSGIRISLRLEDGQETILVSTPGGLSLCLRDNSGTMQITTPDGNRITLDASGITVETSGKCTLAASVVEISAGELVVNAAMSKFSGVV